MASTANEVIHPEIPEHDPAHDINGRLTWIWLIGATIGVFVTFWLTYVFYEYLLFAQKQEKIELLPAEQREALTQEEDAALKAGEGRRSIDQAIDSYVGK